MPDGLILPPGLVLPGSRRELDPSDPINRGLVAFWPLSGGSARTHYSLTGRYHGTSTSGSFVAQRHGRAWQSAGGEITLASPPSVTSPWSVSCRFKSSSTGYIDLFRAYEPGGTYTGWGVAVGYVNGAAPGRLGSYSKSNPGGGWVGATSTTYADGAEHSILVTYDGATLRFYRDGVPDGSGASAAPPLYTGAWAIGLPSGTSVQAMRLHGRALNDNDALRLHKEPWAGTPLVEARLWVAVRATAPTTVDFTAESVAAGAPTVGAPALGQVHALVASGIATGAPTVGTPALGQVHALTAAGVATGAPTVGTPALTQAHALAASGVAAGAPTVGAPAVGQAHALTASGVTTGAPVVGSPTLGQVHALVASGIATGAPTVGTPGLNLSDAVAPAERTITARYVSRVVVAPYQSRVIAAPHISRVIRI